MENLNALPGDNEANVPLDPSRAEVVLPDDMDKVELKLPDEPSALIDIHKRVAHLNEIETAQKLELAKRINEPELYVDKNFDQLKKIDFSKDEAYWAKLEKERPATAEFLKDPRNMAIAKDDIENMGKSEDIIKKASFARQLFEDVAYSGMSQLYSGFLRAPGMIYNMAALPQNLVAKSLGYSQVSSDDFRDINPLEKAAQYYDKSAKSAASQNDNLDFLGLAEKGDISGASKALLRSVAQNAPQHMFNVMLGLTGAGAATTFATAGLSTAAGAFEEGRGSGVDVVGRTLDASVQGMFEGTMESLGTVNFIKEAEQALIKRVGKDSATAILKDMAKTSAASFVTEGTEEFSTQLGQDFSKYMTGVDPSVKDIWFKNAISAGIVGGASGGLMNSPSTSLAVKARFVQKLQADSFKKSYNELVNNESESKLKERSPDAYEMLKRQQVQGTAIENIVVSADVLHTFFQSKNEDPQKVYSELGIADTINDAIETGAKIEIPTEKWLARVSHEDQIALADDVSHSHEAPSVNENKNYDKEITDQLTAEMSFAEQTAILDEKQKTKRQEIYQDMKDELIRHGQDGLVADKDAQIWAAGVMTAAARRGVAPDEWLAKNKPTILNGNDPAPLQFKRNPIPKFESKDIVGEDQISNAIKELGFPEAYQHPEAISAIRSQLAFLKSEIDQAEAGKRTFREGETGSDLIVQGVKSTFPQWFRDGNYKTKKDFEKLVTRGNSKNLASLVDFAIRTLKEGHGENQAFALPPNKDFVALVDPDALETALENERLMAQKAEFFQSSKDLRGYVDSKAKGKAIAITKDSEAPAAAFDKLTGHLVINSEKVQSPEQVDQILEQFGEAKRESLSGKINATIDGEVHELDARKTVNALAAKLYNLERLAECSRG